MQANYRGILRRLQFVMTSLAALRASVDAQTRRPKCRLARWWRWFESHLLSPVNLGVAILSIVLSVYAIRLTRQGSSDLNRFRSETDSALTKLQQSTSLLVRVAAMDLYRSGGPNLIWLPNDSLVTKMLSLAVRPPNSVRQTDLYRYEGIAFRQLGYSDSFVTYLRKAVGADSTNAAAWAQLGIAVAESAHKFERPGQPVAYDVYMMWSEAISYYERALRFSQQLTSPDSAKVALWLKLAVDFQSTRKHRQ
jgi:tetratricopeptide (TPR) repeat protein